MYKSLIVVYKWFIFTTMEMKEKFHGSCFGFICKPIASQQGNSNLQPLGLLAHKKTT
jgi:hypothetical protein